MFASIALALAAQQIVIPLGSAPRQVERPKAPIETAGPAWARACGDSTDWDKPAPPVRIHANSYLVGTCGISAILVTGSDGHVLIDGGTEKGAEVIAAVRQDRPHEFLKFVTGLFPKEKDAKENQLDVLTDEQLSGQLASVLAQLGRAGIGTGEGS